MKADDRMARIDQVLVETLNVGPQDDELLDKTLSGLPDEDKNQLLALLLATDNSADGTPSGFAGSSATVERAGNVPALQAGVQSRLLITLAEKVDALAKKLDEVQRQLEQMRGSDRASQFQQYQQTLNRESE